MCSICGRTRCPSGCPNAEEPKSIYTCDYCGEGILAGDEYVEYGNDRYHTDCVMSMSVKELAEAFDFTIETAPDENPDDHYTEEE